MKGQHFMDSDTYRESSQIRIRPFTLADAPSLFRLPGTLRLDVPDSLVYRTGRIEVAAAIPLLRKERPIFVASLDGRQVGFVRFSPRSPDGRWVATAIAASTGVYAPGPVWEALLHHAVRAAGLRGVRRLFARAPVDHPLIETMHETGWTSYGTETVFRAERAAPLGRQSRAMRKQEPADTWAIHQLYAAAMPRQIQEVEALTSHVWHMDQRQRKRGATRQSSLLLDDDGTLRAYARFTRGPRAAMIDMVTPPGEPESFGELMDGVLATVSRTRPIYFALRGHLGDLKRHLHDRGFHEIGEQELLIRYTTVTARTPAVDPVHFPVELRPALPRRVPTFLEGQAMDGGI